MCYQWTPSNGFFTWVFLKFYNVIIIWGKRTYCVEHLLMTVLEKSRSYNVCSQAKHFCHPTFTCSKLITETIQQHVLKVNIQDTEPASVQRQFTYNVNFEQVSNLVLVLRNTSRELIAYYFHRHLHVLSQK